MRLHSWQLYMSLEETMSKRIAVTAGDSTMTDPSLFSRRHGVGDIFHLAMMGAVIVLAATILAACASDEPEASQPAATAPAATPVSEPTPVPTEAPATQARSIGEVEGITFTVGEGSKATFSVREELASVPLPFDAEISTTALSGEIHLDGRDSVIEIDLQSLNSDNSFRDRYIRSRMFGDHPTGVVTVKGMSDLPNGFTSGESVTTDVESELLIRGVTAPLTFEVEASDEGDEISITGHTTFTWDDLQMQKPSARSVVSLDDEVKVEVLLSARPAN